jgi:ParB-like chromosome segregation protein Spo0J/Txe/YoeB family toxin of Txe-Axe toxin-antitoxin module
MKLKEQIQELIENVKELPFEDKIEALNLIKREMMLISPFNLEPVDCVQWIKAEKVVANDYNPNTVAPPEMKLLEHSITEDGYTQPIVSWSRDNVYEVIDGFHRHRVGKESEIVSKRIHGYLPLVVINSNRTDKTDRISATIRHNRARGKHRIDSMSDIVVELKKRNWSDERICRELGMEQDEVLRLCQITGLAELFTDTQFSKSWSAEGELTEDDFKELNDNIDDYNEKETENFRTVNTNDKDRIFHTYDKWECHKAGFYNTTVDGMTKETAQEKYKFFLSDTKRFKKALKRVITEWKHSCEHYLTNKAMNRIAWLGQAAACIEMGIPAEFGRSRFYLMTKEQQEEADKTALIYLNKWLLKNGLNEVTMEDAISTNQSQIY